jgi:hypothetical protein
MTVAEPMAAPTGRRDPADGVIAAKVAGGVRSSDLETLLARASAGT